jgi:hypothetical protein
MAPEHRPQGRPPVRPTNEAVTLTPAMPFRRLLASCAALLASGCVTFIDPVPPPADAPGTFAALTTPIIMLGDTQEHESTGFPLHDNDGAVDAYVEVAQRPPEQPLFGRAILEWVLNAHPGEPAVHLGDLLDMSCRSELRRMQRVVTSARQEGVLLPGNHDGLMFGIFNQPLATATLGTTTSPWHRGCLRGATASGGAAKETLRDAVVDKRAFIGAYLEMLTHGQHNEVRGLALPPTTGDFTVSWETARPNAFLAGIQARLLDERSYANSFIAQKMRLPRAPGAPRGVIMIGLDTNQVNVLVGSFDAVRRVSPGDIGHVRADQLKSIQPWIEEARKAGDIVVFAGHHNWNRLSFASQQRIAAVMRTLDHPLVYVSAHTHRGFWAKHSFGDRALLELNVNSLSDWPIAYRRVTFALDETARRMQVTAEIMPNLGAAPPDDRAILDAWEKLACGRTGIAAGVLESQERMLVVQQREARGSLMEWLYEGLGEWCRPCLQSLYESGMRYQDAMLTAIDQFYLDLRLDVPEVRAVGTPELCAGESVPVCIARMRAAPTGDLERSMALFRQRAQFIDEMNNRLDALTDPRVRNYMACRAVVASKVDYDLTPDERRVGRGEANRRRMDFFRIEATVGMR